MHILAVARILLSAVLLCALPAVGFTYSVPRDYTQAEYLYVFGQQGNVYLGAEDVDHVQNVFVDVPENSVGDVVIEVYDPDTGGSRDLRPNPYVPWDTSVEFSVYGAAEEPLASKTFGESAEYDKKFYTFGPFNKEDGIKIEGGYRFKFVAKALDGTDQNLFKLRIYPENAESFSDKVSFRLLPNEGDKMYFFAAVPAGVSSLVVENYDLDPDGGLAHIEDPYTGNSYHVEESASAKWAATPIEIIPADVARRLVYVVTKKTQRYANAAVRVKDAQGNTIPLYYAMGRQAIAPRRVAAPAPRPAPDLKCNKFTFDATSSYDPNKEKISYLWEFGDGTTSTEPVVTHIYEKGGQYDVTLTVKDASGLECDTSVSTQKVMVNTPPQVNFSGAESACAGSMITFDASATTDNTPDTLTYAWDLGDGTKAEGKTVSHAYAKGGTYQVRLDVNDNSGTACSTGSDLATIKINSAPTANAGEDVDMCFAAGQDLKVAFDGGRSHDPDGDALTYDWSFGDGESASGRSATHVFAKPGDYAVGLTVSDGKDSACSTSSDSVAVRLNRRPIANAGNDIVACSGSAVTLDGSASQGEGLKYAWDFGDGSTGDGERVTHTYAKGGNYKATLTVDDGNGTRCSTSSSAVNVRINDGPTVSLSNIEAACTGASVRFDASAKDADANALAYNWDFGDGTSAKGGASQSHAYNKGGVYTVTVSVDDGQGTPCSMDSAASRVKINGRPIANAGPNLVCCVDKESVFDGSASSDPDGDSLSYRWNFGDGATAEGAKVTHAYTKSGKYKVALTVDDNSGTSCSSAASSFEAVVNESPVSIIKVK